MDRTDAATVGVPEMPGPLTDDALVRRIIDAASAAPSIHNTQPWRFRLAGPDLIEVHADPDRMLWVADPHGRALHISCGAALFNLRLAIRNCGYRRLVWALPAVTSPATASPATAPPGKELQATLIATVQLAPGRPPSLGEREMFAAVGLRHISRSPFSDRRLPEPIQVRLEQEAGFECTLLRLLGPQDVDVVLRWQRPRRSWRPTASTKPSWLSGSASRARLALGCPGLL